MQEQPQLWLLQGAAVGMGFGGAGQKAPEPQGEGRQGTRNARKRSKMSSEVWLLVAGGQEKYFSAGWMRARPLLRCNQTPLRLPGAFKELAEARGIHVEKIPVFIQMRCKCSDG